MVQKEESCILIDNNDKVLWYNQRNISKEYLNIYIYKGSNPSYNQRTAVLFYLNK